jgi:ketol-acid reductoisomerase
VSDRLDGERIAILGFGNQGEAQALNLRDSGLDVVVGARPEGAGAARARAHGFDTRDLRDAASSARVLAILLPDEVVPSRWPELRAAMEQEASLVFAHGYNLHYGALDLPGGDVVLVSPTGPGTALRAVFQRGEGLPAYLAVHRDAAGRAWELAESYAAGLGCTRAKTLRTTVREETEVDLFGEQAVLCGGMNALVTAAFDTLVARGYAPEMAYLECVHQLKFLADLLHARGIAGLRRRISGTALFGDLTRGPRVIGAEARAELARMLDEIRDGSFAREWSDEVAGGRPRVLRGLADSDEAPIEKARRRAVGVEAGGSP